MRVHFLDSTGIRETHDVVLDLRHDHFLNSLDTAIDQIRQQGGLQWLYRRGPVTLPHELRDDQAPDSDDIGELRQDMEIVVWGKPLPPHLVARERRNKIRRYVGKRFRPY